MHKDPKEGVLVVVVVVVARAASLAQRPSFSRANVSRLSRESTRRRAAHKGGTRRRPSAHPSERGEDINRKRRCGALARTWGWARAKGLDGATDSSEGIRATTRRARVSPVGLYYKYFNPTIFARR